MALPGSLRIRRSLIPVLEVIQASLVSTIFSKSSLDKIVSGTYPPTAVIAAFNSFLSFRFIIKFQQKYILILSEDNSFLI